MNMLRTMLVCAVAAGCGTGANGEAMERPEPMPGESPFEYPVALWDRRLEGETLLLVHVTEMGAVDSAYVYTSSGFPEFDSAAVTGALQLRFAPARQGDRRVPMWTRLPVRFTLDSISAKHSSDVPRDGT